MNIYFQVQTEDQYIFIHDALLEAVIAGTTEVPARSLHGHIQKLMAVEPGENVTGMELEFKVSNTYLFSCSCFAFTVSDNHVVQENT